MHYRKKPIVIEAIQYTGDNYQLLKNWIGLENIDYSESPRSNTLVVKTQHGPLEVIPTDWVIKGVQGEYYPCRDDVFKETYEEAVIDN